MSVSGIQNSDCITTLLQQVYKVTSTSLTAQSISTSGVDETGNADSAEFSSLSELFSKLEDLRGSDPETFESLMNEIADELKSQAEDANEFDAKMLNDLAAKFEDVAAGGDLSRLMPPQPPDFAAGGPPPPPPPSEGGSGAGQTGSGQTEETWVASGQAGQSGRVDMRSLMESIFKKLEDAVSAA